MLSTSPLSSEDALAFSDEQAASTDELMAAARQRRDRSYGRALTFSPKVFLPLTNLCRNRCGYCTFRRSPGDEGAKTMQHAEVLQELSAAADRGCAEALVCIGDKPERAFGRYRLELSARGHKDTVDFIDWTSRQALVAGLLPHTNAGVLNRGDMEQLRRTNVSLGLMLENISPRLCEKGMVHHRAPDKRPALRMQMMSEAGELRIPFTTGILIGIGETARERIESLLAIRDLHRRFGHIQEVIVQNYAPGGAGERQGLSAPRDQDMARTVALARLILDDEVSVQSPPNLNARRTALLLGAGINDFGGISPLTPDFINPRYPWPNLRDLSEVCQAEGMALLPRLPVYERYLSAEFVAGPLLSAARRAQARLRAFDYGLSAAPARPPQVEVHS